MGSIEVAYQYHPENGGFNVDIMVASPPLLRGAGWEYDEILDRIKEGGGNNGETDTIVGDFELYYDPATMTAQQLGGIVVEEQYDSTQPGQSYQALSCYDLSYSAAVKSAVDTLALSLSDYSEKTDFENIRGSGASPGTICYFTPTADIDDYEWVVSPFFDLYDLCERTNASASFNSLIQTNASAVMSAVDDLVVYSFAGSGFSGFTGGQNGIHIFFPDGDRTYDNGSVSGFHWKFQWWYNSRYYNPDIYSGYGKLLWCIDAATQGNSIVENWFEMLDSWFDYTNNSSGGYNSYQY